ncbi:Cytochrome P450 2F2 [Holothuria leucospilota]|uniref:Cytochrome P450 2F2 n=1 Tax=Holothuria leucospilota TaxID=206669 RepID=A0A9Q1HEL4_HOLLE|nr:Cytochrome P450 2F2 [Holothuria leucospilota]
MFDLVTVTAILCVVFALIVMALLRDSPSGSLPKGPPGLPLLGNLLLFRSRAYPVDEILTNWAKEYGKIYRLKIGPKSMYILNGYDCINEVFNNPDVHGRNTACTLKAGLGEGAGTASSEGQAWSCQRHFTLKYFSSSTERLEEAVSEEVTRVLSALNSKPQTPIDIANDVVKPAFYSIMCKVALAKKYNYTDDEFTTILDVLDTVSKNSGPAGLYFSLKLPFGKSHEIFRKVSSLKTLLTKAIDERRDYLMDTSATPSCYADCYLLQNNEGQRKEEGGEHFTDINLIWSIFEFLFGGTAVPVVAMSSIIVYLINNPHVQVRIQQELDSELGDKPPTWAERQRLPYTQAAIAEIMRHANVTFLALPHVARKPVAVDEYRFPAGSIFMSNLHSVMMDPITFPNPQKFDPERFLDEDGNYRKAKELVPFGIGMRTCAGAHFAQMEFFLMTCNILQKMTLANPPGEDAPTIFTSSGGISRSPRPFKVLVRPRKTELST